MELKALKEIPQLKRCMQDLVKEMNEFKGYSTMCLKEIRSGSKGSPDGRMISIMENRDNTRESMRVAYQKYLKALDEGMKILEEIEDVKIRNIFMARYVHENTWNQVANAIGGQATSDSVKKVHDRYLRKN